MFETIFFGYWVKRHLLTELNAIYKGYYYNHKDLQIASNVLLFNYISLEFNWLWAAQLKSHLSAFKNLLF